MKKNCKKCEKEFETKVNASALDHLTTDELSIFEKKAKASLFIDELDSDGNVLWKGKDQIRLS